MIEFDYKGFWVEAEVVNQVENGCPEGGTTFTSYVYWSAESRENHEDSIEDLLIYYDSVEEFHSKTLQAIDKFIRKNKLKR